MEIAWAGDRQRWYRPTESVVAVRPTGPDSVQVAVTVAPTIGWPLSTRVTRPTAITPGVVSLHNTANNARGDGFASDTVTVPFGGTSNATDSIVRPSESSVGCCQMRRCVPA